MKTNINRPFLKREDITDRSNFKDVLLKSKGVRNPFYKSTKWIAGLGIAASVIIVVYFYEYSVSRKEVKTTQVQPKKATTEKTIAVVKPATRPVAQAGPVKEFDRLNGLLKKHSDKAQVFKVSSSAKTKINGKKGTVIDMNPADLETVHGKPLGKEILVELKELTNQSELLKENAQTVSDGRLLASGGAYYLNMTSDGNQLRIKKGKTMKVEFPKIASDSMSLFYGSKDSLGRVNWKETNESFVAKVTVEIDTMQPRQYHQYYGGNKNSFWGYISSSGKIIVQADYDSIMARRHQALSEEQRKYQTVYDAMEISSMGWINCDRFIKEPKTDLIVKFSPKDSIKSAQAYLVFKRINSVMGSSYYSQGSTTYSENFANVPLGYKAKLIAYTVKNDSVYAYASDLTIKKDLTVVPKLELMKESDFAKLLNSN